MVECPGTTGGEVGDKITNSDCCLVDDYDKKPYFNSINTPCNTNFLSYQKTEQQY